MRAFKTNLLFRAVAAGGFVFTTAVLQGAVIEGWNWADDVHDYSSKIQNYGGTYMDANTEWWLTGPADADQGDFVAGWRSNAPGEYIVMSWQAGIPDLPGDDLVIHMYSGPGASANIFAGLDAGSFLQIGTLGGGTPGALRAEPFDFGGLFEGDVRYVKVQREANGPQTGTFFDAFAGNVPVPEPSAVALVAAAAVVVLLRCCGIPLMRPQTPPGGPGREPDIGSPAETAFYTDSNSKLRSTACLPCGKTR